MRLRGGEWTSRVSVIFPGRDGAPFSNQAFNARMKLACKRARVPVISHILFGIPPRRCSSTKAEPTCAPCRPFLGLMGSLYKDFDVLN